MRNWKKWWIWSFIRSDEVKRTWTCLPHQCREGSTSTAQTFQRSQKSIWAFILTLPYKCDYFSLYPVGRVRSQLGLDFMTCLFSVLETKILYALTRKQRVLRALSYLGIDTWFISRQSGDCTPSGMYLRREEPQKDLCPIPAASGTVSLPLLMLSQGKERQI